MKLCKGLLAFLTSLVFAGLPLNAQNVGLNFDGSDDYVQTSYSGISGNSARTVEAWIRTTANTDPNKGGKQIVITDYGNTSTGGRFTFNLLWNYAIRLEVAGSGLSGHIAVNDGNWHHVAGVYDPGATYNFRLLVDGKLDTFGNITTTVNTGTTNNFMIGKRQDNVNFFEGDIDEVRFFNIARTDSAIKADRFRELCKTPGSLVVYYPLNDGKAGSTNTNNKTAYDKSGNGNNGTLNAFTLTGSASNWVSGYSSISGASSSTISPFSCTNYKSPSGKYTWVASGTYTDVVTNSVGCDSVITVKLTIGKVTKSRVIADCDSFTTDKGKTYYTSGIYTDTFQTYRGCDSVIRYILTINNSTRDTLEIESCDSVMVASGSVFYSNGYYPETFKSGIGCDSVVVYHVTINHPVNSYDTLTVCDSVSLYGKWYSKSSDIRFQFLGNNQCDSFRNLHLIVKQSTYSSEQHNACDSFVSASGKVYKKSGQYKEVFTNTAGCDSVHTLNLLVNYSKSTSDSLWFCDSAYINGTWYYSNQWVNQNLQTSRGCDSFSSVYLTITKTNLAVTQTGDGGKVLHAVQTGAKYQWLNCATMLPIQGADSSLFIASSPGNYAVEITLEDCKDTSDCLQVVAAALKTISANRAYVYPNPNNGSFKVMLPESLVFKQLKLYDISGRLIYSSNLPEVAQSFANGQYFIEIETSEGSLTTLLIIQ